MTLRSLRIATTLLCTLPLIWTACGGSDDPEKAGPVTATPAAEEPPATDAATPSAAAAPAFADTEWQLVALESAEGAAMTPDPEAVPTLQFNAQPGPNGVLRVIGFSGCNRFFGDYSAGDDGRLSLPEMLGMTRMACPEPAQSLQAALMKALAGATGYTLAGGELIIQGTNGSLRLRGG